MDTRRHVETFARPSHGENRGSSPLGSANDFKYLPRKSTFVTNACPINGYRQRWTSSRTGPHIQARWWQLLIIIVSSRIRGPAIAAGTPPTL